jgi:hypothetical protein
MMVESSNLYKGVAMKTSAPKVKGRRSIRYHHLAAEVLPHQAIYKSFNNPVIDYPYSLDDWTILIANFRSQIRRLRNQQQLVKTVEFKKQLFPLKCKVRESVA